MGVGVVCYLCALINLIGKVVDFVGVLGIEFSNLWGCSLNNLVAGLNSLVDAIGDLLTHLSGLFEALAEIVKEVEVLHIEMITIGVYKVGEGDDSRASGYFVELLKMMNVNGMREHFWFEF